MKWMPCLLLGLGCGVYQVDPCADGSYSTSNFCFPVQLTSYRDIYPDTVHFDLEAVEPTSVFPYSGDLALGRPTRPPIAIGLHIPYPGNTRIRNLSILATRDGTYQGQGYATDSGNYHFDVVLTPYQGSCSDHVKNGLETGIDCGSSCDDKCLNGALCKIDSDCKSNFCKEEFCGGCIADQDCGVGLHCKAGRCQ